MTLSRFSSDAWVATIENQERMEDMILIRLKKNVLLHVYYHTNQKENHTSGNPLFQCLCRVKENYSKR